LRVSTRAADPNMLATCVGAPNGTHLAPLLDAQLGAQLEIDTSPLLTASLKYYLLPHTLRVNHNLSGQFVALCAGINDRRWAKRDVGSRFVDISLNKNRVVCFGVLLVFSFMLAGGSSGWTLCCLVGLLLVMVL
jgi:hypothetical protein